MKIIGVHDGHNASACLLLDGKIAHAVQEERLSRIKNDDHFPVAAIKEILDQTGLEVGDIDYIALSSYHLAYQRTREDLSRHLRQANSLGTAIRRLAKKSAANTICRFKRKKARIREVKASGFPEDKIVFVEHHTAHAAAAYYGSPFGDEKVLVLTNDGCGDGLCATVSIGCNGRIKRLVEIHEANSLGLIYATVTFLMEMMPNEHEHKIMELAPYASREAAEKSYQAFRSLLRFNRRNPMIFERSGGLPYAHFTFSRIKNAVQFHRFDEVASGLQRWTEEILVDWVGNCIEATGVRKLALSGGIFTNVKANKAISELPEVEELFIFPSCGDETNAIGAAFWVYAQNCLNNVSPMDIPPPGPIYWGREYSDYEVERSLLKQRHKGYLCIACENIEDEVAELLARGEVVARFKGRMEFGARALGNRSILADASRPQVIRVINQMIKNPDFWMPFACAILKEREQDYIVNPKGILSPYTTISYDSTEKVGDIVAGVHPYDLTVTPQIVEREWNPDYYDLMKRFENLTGRGGIVNTSFNLHGHPMVARPEDALDVFERSGLEYLALGNFLVSKKPIELRRAGEEVLEHRDRIRSLIEESRDPVHTLGVGDENLDVPEALDSIAKSTSSSKSSTTATTTMKRS